MNDSAIGIRRTVPSTYKGPQAIVSARKSEAVLIVAAASPQVSIRIELQVTRPVVERVAIKVRMRRSTRNACTTHTNTSASVNFGQTFVWMCAFLLQRENATKKTQMNTNERK